MNRVMISFKLIFNAGKLEYWERKSSVFCSLVIFSKNNMIGLVCSSGYHTENKSQSLIIKMSALIQIEIETTNTVICNNYFKTITSLIKIWGEYTTRKDLRWITSPFKIFDETYQHKIFLIQSIIERTNNNSTRTNSWMLLQIRGTYLLKKWYQSSEMNKRIVQLSTLLGRKSPNSDNMCLNRGV